MRNATIILCGRACSLRRLLAHYIVQVLAVFVVKCGVVCLFQVIWWKLRTPTRYVACRSTEEGRLDQLLPNDFCRKGRQCCAPLRFRCDKKIVLIGIHRPSVIKHGVSSWSMDSDTGARQFFKIHSGAAGASSTTFAPLFLLPDTRDEAKHDDRKPSLVATSLGSQQAIVDHLHSFGQETTVSL
eukprot:scaffold4510_cov183-Amphora_coffeaeformis.AAC.97